MSKRSLSEHVEDRLYNIIASGEKYHLGDRLPNENDLSLELGVSRTTLREAMRSLVAQGILETRRGSGTYVVGNLKQTGEAAPSLRRITGRLQDLYEIRQMIEPQAAFLAAQRATDQEIKRIITLGQHEEEFLRATINKTPRQGYKEWSATDQAFHEAIIHATHNSYLVSLIPMITRSISESILISSENRQLQSTNTIMEHGYIMQYLKDRDPEGTRHAMSLHIHNIIRLIHSRNQPKE